MGVNIYAIKVRALSHYNNQKFLSIGDFCTYLISGVFRTFELRVLTLIDCPKIVGAKGQLTSKTNCQAEDSPKKRTNEFIFTSM